MNVNLDKLIEYKLAFEELFVLYCLFISNKKLITSYVNSSKKIDTGIFKSLEQKNLIIIDKTLDTQGKIYFELLSLTEKGKDIVLSVVKHEGNPSIAGQTSIISTVKSPISVNNFEEFRACYPSKVMRGNVVLRRLHGNLKKCKATYEKLLLETTHDMLCKCAKVYHNEKKKSNSEEYMQNLETWLNQKNYLLYIDEAKKLDNMNNQEEGESNLDAI